MRGSGLSHPTQNGIGAAWVKVELDRAGPMSTLTQICMDGIEKFFGEYPLIFFSLNNLFDYMNQKSFSKL